MSNTYFESDSEERAQRASRRRAYRSSSAARRCGLRRLTSIKPISPFVHDAAADHRHKRVYITDTSFLHGQGIGAHDCKIGELAGFQRAFLIFVEGQKGIVMGCAAKRFTARERLFRRHALVRHPVPPRD